jgi:hypothetical protein
MKSKVGNATGDIEGESLYGFSKEKIKRIIEKRRNI